MLLFWRKHCNWQENNPTQEIFVRRNEMTPAFDEKSVEILCAAIANRRSMGIARVHADKPVDRRLIEQALEAADWAPSHGETEPWRFTVYTGESRRALGEAFAEAYRQDAGSENFKQATYEANRERAFSAPVWISIGVTPALKPDGSLLMTMEEELMATACAVQNLHLVVNAGGMAGMWLSKGVFVHPHTAQFVGLEPPSRLLGFFFFGVPAIPWPAGERRPLSEKVRWMETP
jgi:nitroreductase